jgi:hypothetical protein
MNNNFLNKIYRFFFPVGGWKANIQAGKQIGIQKAQEAYYKKNKDKEHKK